MVPKRRVIFGNTKDADASIQIGRIAGDSGYVADESFLHSFFRELKKGGTYDLIDGLWLPGCCKKDAANKISKLYDLSKQKSTSFGTGGYYDASQSTAGLQQVLSRGDNKGNLVKYSEDLTNAAWQKLSSGSTIATASIASGEAPPSSATVVSLLTIGDAAAASGVRQTVATSTLNVGKTYTVKCWVKAPATSAAAATRLTLNNSIAWNTGGSTKATLTSSWQQITATITLSVQPPLGVFVHVGSYNADGTLDSSCVGSVLVTGVQVTESTWDTDYIATTSAPAYAGLDGKPVVMFDASLGGYSTSATVETKAQPGTIFISARKDGGGTTRRRLFQIANNSPLNDGWCFDYDANTSGVWPFAGSSAAVTTTQETWGAFTVTMNGAASTVRRKGAQIGSVLSLGANQAQNQIFIGTDRSAANRHNGPLGPVIVVRQSLTTAQRGYIESVLNTFFPSTQ